MSEEIEVRDLAIVLDPKSLELKPRCLAFFERVRTINQIVPRIVATDVIETTIQMLDINFRLKISNEQKRRPEKDDTMLSIEGAVEFRRKIM